jgi:hypothetical protein
MFSAVNLDDLRADLVALFSENPDGRRRTSRER